MTQACISIREGGKNRGRACGRPVVGFVAPGQGRCGYHLTDRERARTLAIVRSIRETRELRGLPYPRPDEREDETQRDADADDAPHFDAADFAGPALDEP